MPCSHLLSWAEALPRMGPRSPLQFLRRRRQPSQEIQTSSLNDKARNKTRIKHLLVAARELEQPPAILEAREPAAGISLERLGSRRHV